jgi:hypothetical protein
MDLQLSLISFLKLIELRAHNSQAIPFTIEFFLFTKGAVTPRAFE